MTQQHWQDDPVQAADPDYEGGANTVSLRQARLNFVAFGASKERFLAYVQPPTDAERGEEPQSTNEDTEIEAACMRRPRGD